MRIGLEREAEAEFTPLAAISANVAGPLLVGAVVVSGVDRVGDAELFCRAAVMVRARCLASRAWAGEMTEKRASSESGRVAKER